MRTIKTILTNLTCENFNRGVNKDDSRIDKSIDQALSEIQELLYGAKPEFNTNDKLGVNVNAPIINRCLNEYQDNIRKVMK